MIRNRTRQIRSCSDSALRIFKDNQREQPSARTCGDGFWHSIPWRTNQTTRLRELERPMVAASTRFLVPVARLVTMTNL